MTKMVVEILPGLERMRCSPSNVRHEMVTLVGNGPLLAVKKHQEVAEDLVKQAFALLSKHLVKGEPQLLETQAAILNKDSPKYEDVMKEIQKIVDDVFEKRATIAEGSLMRKESQAAKEPINDDEPHALPQPGSCAEAKAHFKRSIVRTHTSSHTRYIYSQPMPAHASAHYRPTCPQTHKPACTLKHTFTPA